MKHRDRVLLALNHEEPDRCPMHIGFTPEFAKRIKENLGLIEVDAQDSHRGGNTKELERELEMDMLLTFVGWANCYYMDDEDYTDEWGVGWKILSYSTPFGDGHYTEIAKHPLEDDLAIATYQVPDPNRPELYTDSKIIIDNFIDEYWVVGATVCTIFETAWALRGLERLLVDMATNSEIADKLLDIPYKYHLIAAKKLVKLGVDMIWIGDDVGAQNQLLMSPNMWQRYLKPRMANFISELKMINPNLKIAYHTDGYVLPLIPEFIEIGIDILNPIQPACMDPAEIKKSFGNQLSFWGTIDEQHTLPFGTPEDVSNEVLLRMKTIGKNGGLILSPTHLVQLDTPMENFWAMVNTIRDTPYNTLDSFM
jgi:uroporphyrinogen decarboxylase